MPQSSDPLRRENARAVTAALAEYIARGGEFRFVSTEDPEPLSVHFTLQDPDLFHDTLTPHLSRVVNNEEFSVK